VTITAGGTTAVLISEEDGKTIGGIDDLAKLMSLRTFVTKEKKSTASSETREQMQLTAYRLALKEKVVTPDYQQKVLDNSFVIAAKPYQTMCTNVRAHVKSIEENFATDDFYKETLVKYCHLTEKVLVDVLAAMVRGEKEKGLLEEYSLACGLPAYVRNKMVMKSLSLAKDMDLSRILFPSDPSKGLALSVKEWQTPGFAEKLGKLLVNSEIILTILRKSVLFLELIGMSAEQYSNIEDPRVQRVQKTRILVVPPFEDHDRVLSLLERQNFRGFGLPATAMDQSKDRLANLCAVPLRAYAFSVRMAETIPDYYDRIFPNGTIKSPDEKLGNYAKQALAAIKNGTKCELIEILRGETKSKAMMAWIARECKIIPNGELFNKIANALGFDEADADDSLSLVEAGIEVLPGDPKAKVDVVSKTTGPSERLEVEAFIKSVFSIKQKDDRKKRPGQASSVLLREAKVFLKHVKREHSVALAESMEAYFRGFYAEGIQSAAVRIAEARFDEFDDDSDIGSSGDEEPDSEDD